MKPKAPGEPGYDPDRWFAHVINVGLSVARKTGLGLALFNGLRQRFQGVAQNILGQAATMIGMGVREAAAWMQGAPGYIPPLDDLPLAPKSFFGPEETARIVGLFDVPGINPKTGEVEYHLHRESWPEDWSKAMIEDSEEALEESDKAGSPEGDWQADKEAQRHLLFIAKRF